MQRRNKDGKVKKRTEYYCDICGDKIVALHSPFFNKDKVYKIKCYDFEGNRLKEFDYEYVCRDCMRHIIRKVSEESIKED